jgi:putative oxidoreductase
MALPALFRDVAALIARIGIGVVFVAHGWQKAFTNGMDATAASFDRGGIPLPTLSAWFTAMTELVGGAAMIVGFAVHLVGLLLVVIMTGAYLFVHVGNGIFVRDGGGELVIALGATSLLLAAYGGGRYSLDHLIAPRMTPVRRTLLARVS